MLDNQQVSFPKNKNYNKNKEKDEEKEVEKSAVADIFFSFYVLSFDYILYLCGVKGFRSTQHMRNSVQRILCFFTSFSRLSLVNSDNLLTHTHTHIIIIGFFISGLK